MSRPSNQIQCPLIRYHLLSTLVSYLRKVDNFLKSKVTLKPIHIFSDVVLCYKQTLSRRTWGTSCNGRLRQFGIKFYYIFITHNQTLRQALPHGSGLEYALANVPFSAHTFVTEHEVTHGRLYSSSHFYVGTYRLVGRGSLPARRRQAQLGLFVLMLSILFKNLQQFGTVWMNEFWERLEQRKNDEVDEAKLQNVSSITAQQKYKYECIMDQELTSHALGTLTCSQRTLLQMVSIDA